MRSVVVAVFIMGAVSIGIFAPCAKSEDLQQDANKILNSSLGSVGKRVVITVSSKNEKDQEYYAQIPKDKYSPSGGTSAASVAEVTKRLNAAIAAAKKNQTETTITIKVETKVKK